MTLGTRVASAGQPDLNETFVSIQTMVWNYSCGRIVNKN